MAMQKYHLGSSESLILKATCVRHGFWGAYTNELLLTTDNVVCVEIGMLGNHKTNNIYPLYKIKQAVIGKAKNGEKQLELYMDDGSVEDFAFQSDSDMQLRVWVTAIADRFEENNEAYDYNYYQSLVQSCKYGDYNSSDYTDIVTIGDDASGFDGKEFMGDVATNILKSGRISTRSVLKGVHKAAKQQKKKNKNPFIESLKEDFGYYDIVDEFTEMGNEFREEFGLKPKMTHAQEKKIREEEAFRKQEEAFKRRVAETRVKVEPEFEEVNTLEIDVVATDESETLKKSKSQIPIGEQIETLKKFKELVDAGILTEEEFSAKKKEIMGL